MLVSSDMPSSALLDCWWIKGTVSVAKWGQTNMSGLCIYMTLDTTPSSSLVGTSAGDEASCYYLISYCNITEGNGSLLTSLLTSHCLLTAQQLSVDFVSKVLFWLVLLPRGRYEPLASSPARAWGRGYIILLPSRKEIWLISPSSDKENQEI